MLYSLMLVWMIFTFIQGHRFVSKQNLQPSFSLIFTVTFSNDLEEICCAVMMDNEKRELQSGVAVKNTFNIDWA